MSSKSENLKPDAISHSWEQLKIGKFAKTVAGGTPSTTNPSYWNGDIRWMNSGELNHKMVYEVENRITELGLRNSSTSLLPLDCVLIGLAGQGKTRGTVAINKVQLCTNQSIAAILPNDKTLPLYLYYNLDSRYEELRRLSTGDGGRGGLNLSIINGIKIPIPPKEEQKAIANCLSTWDEAIEKQTKLIAAKEQRKKALMQQLLSGKKRLPGFTKDWKEVSLGKLFSERVETKREDLELLSVGQQGVYPQTESNKRDISNADKSKYKRIVPGDIGYNTMRMWQGRSALSGLEGIVSPAYTILIPRDKVDSYFFSCLFKTKKLMHLFWRNSQGLVGDTLNCKYKDFSIIKISIPSFEEQQKISTMLKNQDNEIILMKKKLDFLLGQKKGIMQKLLTGKVRLIP